MSFMAVRLSEELCSYFCHQVSRGLVALLRIQPITDTRAGKAFCSVLPVSPAGSGELCSFPTTIHIYIIVFKMLFILWSF